jgi:fatty-acyl-CoA synthase
VANELTYCINKVGIKTLVIAEKFKTTNYIKILRSLIPSLNDSLNPLDLGDVKNLPSLKNIVLFGDK